MNTHTPGPWEWADVPGAGLQISGPYKGRTRLMFSDIWRQFPEREWDATMVANARLAAAAPELLEALLKCKFDSLNMSLQDMEFCRAVVAKATGNAV